jgi:DNA gyrase/topoisomerase IV subunit B
VEVHGIGMSLINALCRELMVTARERDATLCMSFQGGRLRDQELIAVTSEVTGNTISGPVDSQFQKRGMDTQKLQHWLHEVLAASPSLKLFFNGQEIRVLSQGDALNLPDEAS